MESARFVVFTKHIFSISQLIILKLSFEGARCSSVVRAFGHGASDGSDPLSYFSFSCSVDISCFCDLSILIYYCCLRCSVVLVWLYPLHLYSVIQLRSGFFLLICPFWFIVSCSVVISCFSSDLSFLIYSQFFCCDQFFCCNFSILIYSQLFCCDQFFFFLICPFWFTIIHQVRLLCWSCYVHCWDWLFFWFVRCDLLSFSTSICSAGLTIPTAAEVSRQHLPIFQSNQEN